MDASGIFQFLNVKIVMSPIDMSISLQGEDKDASGKF